MATAEEISRIKGNILRMVDQGASEDDVQGYIRSEGVTEAQLKARNVYAPSTSMDVPKQAAAGLASGIAQGTVGLPGGLAQLGELIPRKAAKYAVKAAELVGAVRPGTAEAGEKSYLQQMESLYPGFSAGMTMPNPSALAVPINAAVAGASLVSGRTPQQVLSGFSDRAMPIEQTIADSIRTVPTPLAVQQAIQPYLPVPQTKAGEKTRLAAEIVGSAAVPVGGAARTALTTGARAIPAAARALGLFGVAPAAGSELGAQAAGVLYPESPEAEAYGRLAGGLLGGLGGTYAALPGRAQRMATTGLRNATQEDYNNARALMQDAQRMGVEITPAEALSSVTGGRVDLTDLQRIIERVEPSGPAMRDFMARRTQGASEAVERLKESISPVPGEPAQIGMQAAGVAKRSIEDVRKSINAETAALYKSAEQGTITQTGFGNLTKNNVFNNVVKQIKDDPTVSDAVKNAQGNSIQFLDAVRRKAKTLADQAAKSTEKRDLDLAARYGEVGKLIDDEINATIQAAQSQSARTGAPLSQNAQRLLDYNQAMALQAEMRNVMLTPFERGPAGDIARAAKAKSGQEASVRAAQAVFPTTTLEGQEAALNTALRALESRNPQVAQQLVRLGIDRKVQRYMADLISGPNQFGGAAFAQSISGSPQKLKNFATAIEAVTNGATAEEAVRLMDVLKATGTRRLPGSATAFNQEFMAAAKTPDGYKLLVDALSKPLSPAARIGTAIENAQFRRVANGIADMLTSPKGLELLQSYGAEGRNAVGRAWRNYLLSQTASLPTNVPQRTTSGGR